jgi:hypothetical protein
MNRSGEFAIVWFGESESDDSYAIARLFDSRGQPLGTNNSFTLNQTHNAYDSVVGIADDGRSVYAWEDASVQKYGFVGGTDIYVRLADSNGVPVGTESRVNTTSNCRHSGAEIAVAGNGSFVIVWRQSSSDADGVYLQRFDGSGNLLGPETRVTRNGTDPQVALAADGRFIVAWQGQDDDGNGIFAQHFLADGSFSGHELWLNEGATNSQSNPLLGMADDGTFIVKWSEGTANFARWISWDATNQTRILGPWIQSMSPASFAAAPITNVVVTFDRLMNPATFTTTNAQLTDPVGRVIPIISVQTTNNQSFTLSFAPQELRGSYRLTVDPNIQDSDGALMDQNGNATKGEAVDAFQTVFTVAPPTAASVPFVANFESGSVDALGSCWSFATTVGGVIDVLPTVPATDGAYSLRLNGGPEASTLTIDLAGATDVTLDFWALQTVMSFGYYGAADVSISEDSTNWQSVVSPYAYAAGWHHFSVELDAAIQAAGMHYSTNFQIRFTNPSGYYTPQDWYWDNVRVTTNSDVLGPRVTSQTPTGLLTGPVGSCMVTFNESITPSNFTAVDVQVVGPAGLVIPLNTNSAVMDTGNQKTFTLNFAAPQSVAGLYTINVGPHVTDIAGNEMDQDANGVSGDGYTGIFQVLSDSATTPFMEDFESGSIDALRSCWSFATTGGGVIDVEPMAPATDGASSLRLNGGPEASTLTINLAGATDVTLDFWALQTVRSFGYYGAADVSICQDNTNWHSVLSPFAYAAGWHHFSVDLDAAIRAADMHYSTNFQIRFTNPSGYYTPQDWYWDNVRVLAGNPNVRMLVAPSLADDGQFQVNLTGAVGRDFVIQVSTNLTTWIAIATNMIPVSGILPITDPAATNYSRRFYRAMAQ